MTRSAPRHGPPSHRLPTGEISVELPSFGTVPLGPDEPELFTDAMERILDHLGGQATSMDRFARPNQ
jgi:hypothetical protein